jgi:hypothetical protein
MNRAFLITAGLMIGSMANAQTATPVPNAQTGGAGPAAATQAPSSTTAITQPDSGSSIDRPALASPEPQTGYHAPVIGARQATEPPPHARIRAADRKTCTPTTRADCQTPAPR